MVDEEGFKGGGWSLVLSEFSTHARIHCPQDAGGSGFEAATHWLCALEQITSPL
jgi:hypothetical protein